MFEGKVLREIVHSSGCSRAARALTAWNSRSCKVKDVKIYSNYPELRK